MTSSDVSDRHVVDTSWRGTGRRSLPWFSWLLGTAALGAVIVLALHFSEEREFVRLAEKAEPWWLFVAVLLQAITYFGEGQQWRLVAAAKKIRVSARSTYKLALAKLFVDQALPSAGISGTIVIARGLERRGVPRPVVMAGVVVDTVSYYAAYFAGVGAALVIMVWSGHGNFLVFAIAIPFVLAGAAISASFLGLAGRTDHGIARLLMHVPVVKNAAVLLRQADPQLARRKSILVKASLYQLSVVVLDAASLWVLLRSLGAHASPAGVFASFMISTLFRVVGVIPGGLGTFEAASLLTLKMVGVPLAAALSATLLFRGLSFWLPMIPGLLFSREAGKRSSIARLRVESYWSMPWTDVALALGSKREGLTSADAESRLAIYGSNEIGEQRRLSRLRVVWNQLRSPLVLLLVFAAGASAITAEWIDAWIVFTIVVASVTIGASREYQAQVAAAALRAQVRTHADVFRDGRCERIPVRDVVPGDVVRLSAGSIVPGDVVVLEATDFFVNEAVLTGESFPVEKKAGVAPLRAPLRERLNCAFFGTNVRSGTSRCLVVETGKSTQFGAIAHRLTLRPPETEFDRGLRHFGYLLTSAMFVMVMVVFAINVLFGRPPIETLLFSIALAVGLSPELLPAILNVNLGRGAQLMARHGVLVRKLNAIENLGSMDVLCTDKTGTLTEGVVRLEGAYDAEGRRSAELLTLASYNAALQTGLSNPLDHAILQAETPDLGRVEKLAEIPYDFVRKRLSVVLKDAHGIRLVTKGAFAQVLEACTQLEDGARLDAARRAALQERFDRWSREGTRALAVAGRRLTEKDAYGREDEQELQFNGFLTFLDRPKEGVGEALTDLSKLGVSVKLITGDTKLVAQHVASTVGMRADRMLTGGDLDDLHDDALWQAAEHTDLFVEVDPNQKERIIRALKKTGHVVGFLGDGVNDAPAMHAADTSLSVEEAVDVAKEAADFVLLERHLDVIRRGIQEGRKTFANTLKYVLMTMSANLGNMVSMAVASLFLPFLPLLASQILLNNFLSDIPAIGLAEDSVDPELVERPRRWNMSFIGRFMIEFGILSSMFDFLTFAALLGVFAASPELFRTGWFVESLMTELVVALVVRTRRPFYRSRPATLLLWSSVALIILTVVIPFLPRADILGFVPLPATVLATLGVITVSYVVAAEVGKSHFYRQQQVHTS